MADICTCFFITCSWQKRLPGSSTPSSQQCPLSHDRSLKAGPSETVVTTVVTQKGWNGWLKTTQLKQDRWSTGKGHIRFFLGGSMWMDVDLWLTIFWVVTHVVPMPLHHRQHSSFSHIDGIAGPVVQAALGCGMCWIRSFWKHRSHTETHWTPSFTSFSCSNS